MKYLGDILTFLAISATLSLLAILPAMSASDEPQEQASIAQSISLYTDQLIPPGKYEGRDHFGERCSVENRANHTLRVQSSGFDFSLTHDDWGHAEDFHSDTGFLQLVLRDGGLQWCQMGHSRFSVPCWKEARLHKTVWVGREASQQPFVSILDGLSSKADCYELVRI